MFSVKYDIWLSHCTVCFQIEITILMLDVNCKKNTDVILTSEWRVWSKPINGKSFHIMQEHKIWLYEYSNLDHTEENTDIKRLRNFCV